MQSNSRKYPAGSNEPQLVLLDSPDQPLSAIKNGETRIGRATENDLRLDECSVSRLHCRLVRDDSGIRIYDENSSNRTRVNNAHAQGQHLEDGDILKLGRCKLMFKDPRQRPQKITSIPGPSRRPLYRSRRDKLRHAWQRDSRLALGLIVLLSSSVGGWFFYQSLFTGTVSSPENATAPHQSPAGLASREDQILAGPRHADIETLRKIIEGQEDRLENLKHRIQDKEGKGRATGDAQDLELQQGHLRDEITRLGR